MIATELSPTLLRIEIGARIYENVTPDDWLWEKYWNAVDDGWEAPPQIPTLANPGLKSGDGT